MAQQQSPPHQSFSAAVRHKSLFALQSETHSAPAKPPFPAGFTEEGRNKHLLRCNKIYLKQLFIDWELSGCGRGRRRRKPALEREPRRRYGATGTSPGRPIRRMHGGDWAIVLS